MENLERIKFALGHINGKSVAIFNRKDWHSLVLSTGEPTKLTDVPEPISGVKSKAVLVAVLASGTVNPNPGIDLVRYDAKDAPYVYNIDHYTVIENLPRHPQYYKILSIAKIQGEDELRTDLGENVFIVGPEKLDHHRVREHPDFIKNARSK